VLWSWLVRGGHWPRITKGDTKFWLCVFYVSRLSTTCWCYLRHVFPPRKSFTQIQAQVLSLERLRYSCVLEFYSGEDLTSKSEVAVLRLVPVYWDVPRYKSICHTGAKGFAWFESIQFDTWSWQWRLYVAKRPSTLPWGTKAGMHLIEDLSPILRSKRYDFRRCAVGRRLFRLNSKPSCHTRATVSD